MAGNAGAKQRFMDQFVLGDPQEEANYSRATLRRNAESPAAPAYLGSPREGRGELEVEPHYSNAHELDEIITRFKADHAPWVGMACERTYVGKIRCNAADAAAVGQVATDDSQLILFNVGLGIACHFWAVCFLRYVAEFDDLYGTSRQAEHDAFIDGVIDVFLGWSKGHQEIYLREAEGFFEQFSVVFDDASAIYACASDRFIVGHEFAHHLAGDTRGVTKPHRDVQRLIDSSKRLLNGRGSRELAADMIGFMLTLGTFDAAAVEYDRLIASGIGAGVTLGAISALSPEPYHDGSEHYPSSAERMESMLVMIAAHAMREIAGPEPWRYRELNRMKKYLMNFNHAILGRRKARGLIRGRKS